MLRMEQIAAIKQMSQSESISTIASALNIDWKTARKYAGMDDFNVSVESFRAHRRGSKLDPYKSEIDRIMDEEEQGQAATQAEVHCEADAFIPGWRAGL